MKPNRLVALVCCTAFAAGLIFWLYMLSPIRQKLRPGGFKRSYLSQLFMQGALDLRGNSFYIAGIADSTIYLGSTMAIDYLAFVDFALRDFRNTRIKTPLDSVRSPGSFRLSIDSPYFFITNGVEPVILRGTLGEWYTAAIPTGSTSFFVDAIPISNSSFAIKSYNTAAKEFELAKNSPNGLYFNNDLLVKQVDGIFCVDGRLHFHKKNNELLYLYFYRNEYIVMDTALQIRYRGNTIDTITHAKIQSASLKHGSESMMSRPPGLVNGLSCVVGDTLYVQSMIMANNDEPEKFLTTSTIDQYDILTGKYISSFQIPRFKDHILTSFQIVGNMVFAIYGNDLVRYDFIKPSMDN